MSRQVTEMKVNRNFWKMSTFSIKKKIFYCCAFFVLFFLLLSVNVHYYLSPKFISFEEVSQALIPRSSLADFSTINVCEHQYETQLTNEQISTPGPAAETDLKSTGIALGGFWSPKDCVSKYRVNIIVPYRDRQHHLNEFLHYFHRYLQLQQIDYRILVVEQSPGRPFNRGKLFNVGFVEAEKRFPADCYIFHDVQYSQVNTIYFTIKLTFVFIAIRWTLFPWVWTTSTLARTCLVTCPRPSICSILNFHIAPFLAGIAISFEFDLRKMVIIIIFSIALSHSRANILSESTAIPTLSTDGAEKTMTFFTACDRPVSIPCVSSRQ